MVKTVVSAALDVYGALTGAGDSRFVSKLNAFADVVYKKVSPFSRIPSPVGRYIAKCRGVMDGALAKIYTCFSSLAALMQKNKLVRDFVQGTILTILTCLMTARVSRVYNVENIVYDWNLAAITASGSIVFSLCDVPVVLAALVPLSVYLSSRVSFESGVQEGIAQAILNAGVKKEEFKSPDMIMEPWSATCSNDGKTVNLKITASTDAIKQRSIMPFEDVTPERAFGLVMQDERIVDLQSGKIVAIVANSFAEAGDKARAFLHMVNPLRILRR
ncbi:MAG: hypothetical protein LBF72_01290 [Holosporales bacterium]|nr:hypothetical protein [Holosporales bacterium]